MVRNKCNDEAIYLKKIIKNPKYNKLINETKRQLISILIKMRDELNINLISYTTK